MPGQDLTRVTIPAFFLESRSLLERLADTLMHPDALLAAAKAATPFERMKGVVQWFLSGFHYKTVGVRKPYNPIIGETFACYWKHPDGSRSQYFAEQVLHRPPVSAIYFENRQNNIVATAHVWTKSQFSAPQTVKSILEGACYLHFLEHGEVRHSPRHSPMHMHMHVPMHMHTPMHMADSGRRHPPQMGMPHRLLHQRGDDASRAAAPQRAEQCMHTLPAGTSTLA